MENTTFPTPNVEDDTGVLSSKTNAVPKRSLVKPLSSKISTLAKPTSTSTTRAVPGSSLSKPPTRPTATATVRKPPIPTTSTHQKRASTSSIDARTSGDEKKSSGITAKPKRMSIASSTTIDRLSAAKTSPVASSRRSTTHPPATTTPRPSIRASTLSPTKARQPITLASRTTAASSGRSRPLTSSTLRNPAISDGKKRLSTIPASPAVKADAGKPEEDKENILDPVIEGSERDATPSLETHPSSRSELLAQRIREFAVVNEMLQAAISSEGAVDDEEHERMENEAAETMAKLKRNLMAATAYDKERGLISSAEESTTFSPGRGLSATAAAEIESLRTELSQSQAQSDALTRQVEDLKAKMTEFGKIAEEESSRIESSTAAIRVEHSSIIDSLKASHTQELSLLQNRLDANKRLHAESYGQVEAASETQRVEHEKAIKELIADHSAKISRLQDEMNESKASEDEVVQATEGKLQAANSAHTKQIEELTTAHKSAVLHLQRQLEEANTLQQQTAEQSARALEAARASAATAAESKTETLLSEQKQTHEKAMEEIQLKHQNEVLKHTSALQQQASQHEASFKTASSKAEEAAVALENYKIHTISEREKQGSLIKSLQDKIVALEQARTDELDSISRSHSAATSEYEDKIASLSAEIESASHSISQITADHSNSLAKKDDEVAKLTQVISKLQEDLVKAHESHSDETAAKISKLKQEHAEAISKHTDDAARSRLTHEQQIQSMHKQHNAEAEESRNSLAALQKKSSDDAEAERLIFDKKIEELEASSEKALAVARTQAQDQSSATQMQLHTLKNILASVEEESRGKDAEHEKALAKLEQDLSMAVQRLAGQSSKMMEIQTTHDLNLKRVKHDHEQEIEELKKTKDEQHEKAIDEILLANSEVLEAEHAAKVAELEKALATAHTTAKEAQTQAASRIAEIESKHKASAAAHVKKAAELKEKISALEESQQMVTKSSEDIESLKAEHAKTVAGLESAIAASTSKSTELEAAVAERGELRTSLKNAEETAASLTAASQRSVQETTGLKHQLEAALRDTKNQLAETDELRQELAQLKITSVGEQKEMQKVLDLTREELREARAKAEIPILHSPAGSVRRPKSKSPARRSLNESMKSLNKSKWASEETAPAPAAVETPTHSQPETPQTPTAQNLAAMDEEKDGKSNSAGEKKKKQPRKKKRNVEGAVAGIQEQIKQLKELDQEELEDHQKMARTLSKALEKEGDATQEDAGDVA